MYDYSPPEGGMGLWYDPKVNRFFDDDGLVRHDLHKFFDLWQLDEWKNTRRYGTIMDRDGVIWDVYYAKNPFDDTCEHNCDVCSSKCEVYGAMREWQQEQSYIQMRREIFQ